MSARSQKARAGVVYLVGGGPGDPGLLTLRGADLVASADVVLHDALIHEALLALASPSAEVRFVGKRGGDPVAKQSIQSSIEADLVALAKQGKSVVRLKGGDPFLFGRGSEEAEALAKAGVAFEIVPGVCSPLAASAYAGISLTHRDLASSVTFVSGTTRRGKGFDWSELSAVRGTICVLMGVRRIEEVASGLAAGAGRDPETPCVVIERGTRADQRVVEGTLRAIAEKARAAGIENPALIVVGPATELRRAIRWFDLKPMFGKRVLITRPKHQAEKTAELVRLAGAEPIVWPAIAIEAPPDPERVTEAVRALGGYDVVIFTSDNGVARFFDALAAEGRDARAFGQARVAAVGSATSAALEARGIKPDIVPEVFVGDALAEAILADPVLAALRAQRPLRALIPRALVAREVVVETLRAAGALVDVVAVYETRPASVERVEELTKWLENKQIDVVLLTSSSTATQLVERLGSRASELLAPVLLASIGPVTTKAAEARGLLVEVTAEESTLAGLLDAIEKHYDNALAPLTRSARG